MTQKSSEKELIELAIMEAMTDYEEPINKEKIQDNIKTNLEGKNVQVSDKRPNEVYQYIVSVEENLYGIKQDNSVEILEPGIRNHYIEISEVTEETPKYTFKDTITQEDVDKDSNQNSCVYTIIGVSNEEDGEYISEGTIEGKSGYLSIIDLQNTEFEYTLNDFMKGDEVFFVKIKINNSVEKIQKLTLVQADIVTYQENFAGISYIGDYWSSEDDINDNYLDGKAKYGDTTNGALQISFSYTGTKFELYSKTTLTTGYLQIKILKENETNAEIWYRDTKDDIDEENYVNILKDIIEDFEYDTYNVQITQAKKIDSKGFEKDFYVDAIRVYK